jgi:hypothetical protein
MNTQLSRKLSFFDYCPPFLFIALTMLCQALAAPASADSPIPDNKVPQAVEDTARGLEHDLEQQGYEVARGYFKLYTQDDCLYSYEVLHTCLGNNPAAPYVLPIVPAWPDEWVDPATVYMVGPTFEGYNASYRLDKRDAIVILGLLPPPARYFGVQSYLLSSQGKWKKNREQYLFVRDHVPALRNTFFTTLPGNPERLQLFADLSDPNNNVVIEQKSSAVWDQVRNFVITPDRTMDLAIRQALVRLGIPENTVFTEQIPSKIGDTNLKTGLGEKSDDFLSVIRYAMPVDTIRADAWREDLPLVVLRIRDTRSPRGPQLYPWVAYETRSGTTPPETTLQPDLVTLAGAICDRWGQPCHLTPLLNMKASGLKLTGPECVKVGMNCLAPNEDVAYFMSSRLWLPDDRVYAVVGALGTRTGNATYVGLGLNSSATQEGFANIEDDTLAGTADGYDVPNHARFFVQYFARDCKHENLETLTAGSHCYSVGDQLPDCADPADMSCAMLVLSMRNYLLPDSRRGPLPELTLSPLVIPLQRPQETE